MPQYVLELKLRNDRLKRGGGRNAATYQTTVTNKHSGDIATWVFACDDTPVALRDFIESTVAAATNPVFVD